MATGVILSCSFLFCALREPSCSRLTTSEPSPIGATLSEGSMAPLDRLGDDASKEVDGAKNLLLAS
jgi:hypothetical protein